MSSAIIVIPCYNEAGRLQVHNLQAFSCARHRLRFHFVNDGSTDDTWEVLEALHASDPQRFAIYALLKNVGKAEAVHQGILQASASGADYVGYCDADLTTPLEAIPAFCDLLDARPDLLMVFGARVRLLGRTIERRAVRHYLGRIFATASKAVDEYLGLAYHRQIELPVVIFRLFNTVGPRQTGQYGMVIPRFVQQALAGQALTVYGDGHQTRCFCHVQDVVAALIGLSECPAAVGKVFNIGSEEEVSILDLARQVVEVVDTFLSNRSGSHTGDERISFIPYEEAYDSGFEDLRRRVPDISKIRRYTGWGPTWTLEKVLGDIVSHYIGATSTSRETPAL